ncbi:hypothetical protein [Lysobacter gummosus]|uniref:hypothetical protein n=1 Tax=Lysobacter gummosus TaxID=262324 RepID=UPI00363A463E
MSGTFTSMLLAIALRPLRCVAGARCASVVGAHGQAVRSAPAAKAGACDACPAMR